LAGMVIRPLSSSVWENSPKNICSAFYFKNRCRLVTGILNHYLPF
jgi:hypothetical protein